MILDPGQAKSIVRRTFNRARYILELGSLPLNGSIGVRHRPIRIALVSDGISYTSEQQFNPFSRYRSELRHKLRLVSLHLPLKDVLRAPSVVLSQFDIIILKMSFRTSSERALGIARTMRSAALDKRILYFDGDDDLCIQWPEILPYVDLYIKKHLFRDRTQYLKSYVGKSNLTDYVHRQFGQSFSDDPIAAQSARVPIEHLGKIMLGCNLALDREIVRLYDDRQLRSVKGSRENDIMFRGSVPKDWIYHLRKDIEPTLKKLEKSFRVIAPNTRVAPDEYYREMTNSKICISPFGYGEICWRDFEAILCGCLLIKPDMGHIETNPDAFRPHQTYVPVRWDYSDLEEKCIYYLNHADERERIATAAFNVLDDFYGNGGFLKMLTTMLQQVSFYDDNLNGRPRFGGSA